MAKMHTKESLRRFREWEAREKMSELESRIGRLERKKTRKASKARKGE